MPFTLAIMNFLIIAIPLERVTLILFPFPTLTTIFLMLHSFLSKWEDKQRVSISKGENKRLLVRSNGVFMF